MNKKFCSLLREACFLRICMHSGSSSADLSGVGGGAANKSHLGGGGGGMHRELKFNPNDIQEDHLLQTLGFF